MALYNMIAPSGDLIQVCIILKANLRCARVQINSLGRPQSIQTVNGLKDLITIWYIALLRLESQSLKKLYHETLHAILMHPNQSIHIKGSSREVK